MSTGNPIITFNGGEDVEITCAWTVDGNAVNLTGYTVTADLAWPGGSLALAVGSGITITDAANGRFTIALDETQSAALLPGNQTQLITTFVKNGVTTKIGPARLRRIT